MKKRIFTGAGVALVTPMNADGSVNWDRLAELIEFQVNGGTDCIVICGTTGESATLTDDEHLKCIYFAVEKVGGRIPVVAGASSNDTAYAMMLARESKQAGADGILCVTPYYNKASQRGLIKHYNMIADATDLPMILYNVPSRTGCNILPETYYELSKHPNIVATKEANGSINSVARTRALCGDALDVYSGDDDQIVPILSLGGIGVISVLSNILPKETHDICQLYFDGKVKESSDLQISMIGMVDALFCDVNPIPVKAALNMMGWDVGNCRMPLCETTPENLARIEKQLKLHGLVK
ncbi:MAG: 4-hydroxy-tetrahydrodipicolinate synthase [Oscillospiraceae bacterium]|nr:4-hydroxy-tetrahydrodipicolinate synthase [Oscillospiraceae bacterium]